MDRLTNSLLAARDGDEHALATAIRIGQADVARFVRPLVDPSDLDDVVQDTFIRAYRALPNFRGDASGRTWLLAIARRSAADAIRTRVRIRRTERQTPTQPGGPSFLDTAHALQSLVDGLDVDRREAFVLTQVVGCSYADTAAICGVPIGTIRSRVARARESLLEQVHAARSA